MSDDDVPGLADLRLCFEGAVPAVIATASAAGVPNVTYLSRVRYVDDEHVALSNQFFSKTSRNLVENPRASMLLVDPTTYSEFRLTLVFERTVKKGPVFQKLREDVEEAAAHHGMQDVFKLRAADLFRVLDIERHGNPNPPDDTRWDWSPGRPAFPLSWLGSAGVPTSTRWWARPSTVSTSCWATRTRC